MLPPMSFGNRNAEKRSDRGNKRLRERLMHRNVEAAVVAVELVPFRIRAHRLIGYCELGLTASRTYLRTGARIFPLRDGFVSLVPFSVVEDDVISFHPSLHCQ